MSAANDNIKDAKAEAPRGFKAERLNAETLEKNWSEIAGLEFNALDKTEGRSYGERKEEINALYSQYLKPGTHGELFVLKKDGRIVAFLALERLVAERKAVVHQFRLSAAHSPGRVLQEIVRVAREFLQERGYYSAEIDTEDARPAVGKMAHHFPRFLKIKEAVNDDQSSVSETKEAA